MRLNALNKVQASYALFKYCQVGFLIIIFVKLSQSYGTTLVLWNFQEGGALAPWANSDPNVGRSMPKEIIIQIVLRLHLDAVIHGWVWSEAFCLFKKTNPDLSWKNFVPVFACDNGKARIHTSTAAGTAMGVVTGRRIRLLNFSVAICSGLFFKHSCRNLIGAPALSKT
jgi:hypothetical protein